MGKKGEISRTSGNTPVKNVPADYYPEGCGFWFVIPEGLDAGKKMFFRDSSHGFGVPTSTIVFVHGNPESSYIYRNIICEIIHSVSRPVRIVAMDHIGFGLSDLASYEMVSMDHADNLLQLIRFLDLSNVTLVIHDWGGPIGVGAFLKEPERVDNLVFTNSTVFPMPKTGMTYTNYPVKWLPWSKSVHIIPDRFWGTFAAFAVSQKPSKTWRIIIRFIWFMSSVELGLSAKNLSPALSLFREQFKSKSNVRSSKRLVSQSAVWGNGNVYKEPELGERDTGPFYKFIQDNLHLKWGLQIQAVGVRAVLGRWDPAGKEEVIAQWISSLPQLEGHVRVFENEGHFIEETQPGEVAKAIFETAGLTEGYPIEYT